MEQFLTSSGLLGTARSNHEWEWRVQPDKRKQLCAQSALAAHLAGSRWGGQRTSGTLASHEPQQAVGQHEKAMAAVGVRLPDLHAFTPGAHVLPEEEVVQCDGPHDVEHLLDHLLDQFGVHAVLTHDWVERVELPQDGVQCVGTLISNAGGSLS